MKIEVKRIEKGDNSTLSEVFVDGVFCCYGLEDLVRDVKVWGATAIPAGTYKLGLRKLGAMNARYARLFPAFHQGMIEILAIPNFKYVYIHMGNNFGDTAGCLLVGDSFRYIDEDFELRKSKAAYTRLYKKLVEMVKRGEATITIEGTSSFESSQPS